MPAEIPHAATESSGVRLFDQCFLANSRTGGACHRLVTGRSSRRSGPSWRGSIAPWDLSGVTERKIAWALELFWIALKLLHCKFLPPSVEIDWLVNLPIWVDSASRTFKVHVMRNGHTKSFSVVHCRVPAPPRPESKRKQGCVSGHTANEME